MTDPIDRHAQGWDAGFEGHTLAQRKRLARLTLAEKLDWLEEAQRLAARLERSRIEQGGRPSIRPRDVDNDPGTPER